MRILYITFFESVTDNGIYETQVKQFLCELSHRSGGTLSVSHLAILPAAVVGRDGLSTPFLGKKKQLRRIRDEYQESGVRCTFLWLPVLIPKRWKVGLPLVAFLPVLLLSYLFLLCRIARERPQIIHCRSYPATLLAILTKYIFKEIRVVFDPRGFWPEEGVVTGRWKEQSVTFKFWKRVEKFLLLRSDKVIALSESFAERIAGIVGTANCSVIYASAAVEKFVTSPELRNLRRRELGLEGRDVLVYSGSLPFWHDPQLIAAVFKAMGQALNNPGLLVLTGYDKTKLLSTFAAAGVDPKDFKILNAKADEVPGYLAAADYGLVPLKEITHPAMGVVADTMIGTKVAEYLAAGLPIVVNRQVGGLRSLMERYKIGVFFDSIRLECLAFDAERIQRDYAAYRSDCLLVSTRYLSLERTASAYHDVYSEFNLRPNSGILTSKQPNSCTSSAYDPGQPRF